MSRYKKPTLIVSAILICIAFLGVFFVENVKKQTIGSPPPATKSTREANFANTESLAPVNETEIETSNFRQCETFTKRVSKENNEWFNDHYLNWDDYLEKGYSLDEVTLAVEHFVGDWSAADFRLKYFRKNAGMSIRVEDFKQQIESIFPDFFALENRVHIEDHPPQTELKNFNKLDETQRNSLLAKIQPNVDDIAFFITNSSFTDEDIIQLLNTVENPTAAVSYDKVKTTSLLDFAANYGRLQLVKHLLDDGFSPTNDPFLPSTMEHALSRLYVKVSLHDIHQIEVHKPGIQDAVKIVSLLHSLDSSAVFRVKTYDLISGVRIKTIYQFDAERIQFIMTNFGFDLTQLGERERMEVDPENELIGIIEQQRVEHLKQTLGLDTLPNLVSECESTIAKVAEQWQPNNMYYVIDQARVKHSDDIEKVESDLAIIDPKTVDFFRSKYNYYNRSVKPTAELDEQLSQFTAQLKTGDILPVIQHFEQMSLSGPQKNWVFIQLLGWNVNYYSDLVNSSLFFEPMEYYELSRQRFLRPASLSALNASGADLFSVDMRGKSMLYYAAQTEDIASIKYMVENNFPFDVDVGEDPLHSVLSHTRIEKFGKRNIDILTVIDLLMEYKPAIDKFHLGRMAVIQLMYPGVYQQIIEAHPQLTVLPSTELPRVK